VEDLAVEAVVEAGIGGHFFATAHTMQRYRDAFYTPMVSDWRNYGAWLEDGGKSATERANRVAHATLAAFQPPAQDPAVGEALRDFVARRRSEGGALPVS
jgi:trimethylamine--corrinoid protein Co-methyltransferase